MNGDPSNSPKSRGIRGKLGKVNEKKQGSPKLKRMMETETRTPKQLVKPEKVRGIADGERKINCVESASQDKLNVIDQQKVKQKAPANGQTYQESPSKITTPNSTGIPKPMAAVKGTSKPLGIGDMSPLKTKSPSIPRIPIEIEKQKRDDVCVALVSPMRTSVNEEIIKTNEAEKPANDGEKKLKDVEEEEMMSVKPMSPLMNGYRLGSHSGLHFTHPGYLNNAQSKNVYYSHVKDNANLTNLESIDLAMGMLSD